MKKTRKNRNTYNKTKKNRVFTKKEYNSGDGMLTKVWGPAMWHYLHTMSFNYPVKPTSEQKKHYRDFVVNLKNVLPCKYCRMNLTNNFKKKPLNLCHMKNRETFSRYIYELHELVNKMLGKNSGLSYCDVRERYEHFRARCTQDTPKVFKFKETTPKNLNKTVKNTVKNTVKKTDKKDKKEKGCTEPLYGKKSKCIINIVPIEDRSATLKISQKCLKKHVS